jgi:predicted phosphodiesterase
VTTFVPPPRVCSSCRRVAALYDIHGNAVALEAAVREIRAADVDLIVVGGDVLPGPMPRETLECLTASGIATRFIHGNGDRVVAAQMAGGDISEVPEVFREVIRWTARQLDVEQRLALADWPPRYQVEISGLGQVLFCHATPRNDTEIFTRLTSEDRLAPVFAGVNASVVVCGHTHMQFDRTVGSVRVVNAGSVGMPFAAPRGAYWLLLGPDVQLRCTDYDFGKAAQEIRATTFPQAETLAVRYVLDPPTEAETLQIYASADLSRVTE